MFPIPIISNTNKVKLDYDIMSHNTGILLRKNTELWTTGMNSNYMELTSLGSWKKIRDDVLELICYSPYSTVILSTDGNYYVYGWDINDSAQIQRKEEQANWRICNLNAEFKSTKVRRIHLVPNYAFMDRYYNAMYYNTMMALGLDGSAVIWGWNTNGQFGNSGKSSSYSLTPYNSGMRYTGVRDGFINSGCGILIKDTEYCYSGINSNYENGTGNNTPNYNYVAYHTALPNRTYGFSINDGSTYGTQNTYYIEDGILYGYGTYKNGLLGNNIGTGYNERSIAVRVLPENSKAVHKVLCTNSYVMSFCADGSGYYLNGTEGTTDNVGAGGGGGGGEHLLPIFIPLKLSTKLSDIVVVGCEYGQLILDKSVNMVYGCGSLSGYAYPGITGGLKHVQAISIP